MAKDIFHEAVREALIKDGWIITHDPYPIRIMDFKLDIDLGAERMLAAERDIDDVTEKIAIEVKSFVGASFMRDFHVAVGQYTNYKVLLRLQESGRKLYLAVPKDVYEQRFEQPGIRYILDQTDISIVVYDEDEETIALWKK